MHRRPRLTRHTRWFYTRRFFRRLFRLGGAHRVREPMSFETGQRLLGLAAATVVTLWGGLLIVAGSGVMFS